jgi:RecA/RadA recombinase
MAKKATKKKKAPKKAVKKSAAKKKSKAQTPLKDRDDLETPTKAARNTWAEIAAAESDQSWLSEQVSMEVSRYPRIFTGLVDVDTLFAPTVGSRIEVAGPAHTAKSTTIYMMIGTLLRTCRRCCTFAVEWLDEETGEIIETCRCGANEFMEGALIDIEEASDPVWLDIWRCRTGHSFREKIHGSGAFKVLESEKQRRLHILRPISGGPMYTFLQKAIAKGAVDFVAIDAINSVMSDEALAKDAGKKNVADRAKMNWDGLRRLCSAQNEHSNRFGGRATVIWSNHLIANIGGWEKETEAGGGGAKIMPDQKMRYLFSKVNEGKKKDLPFHAYRETFFNVTKNRAGFIGGGSGSFKLFLNEVKHNRVTYWPGDTDDPERMLNLLRDLGLFENKKSKYLVLGREFKKVQEIKDFLSREDIQMECRFWLGALRMPTIARAHLRFEDYCYSPFESARRAYERTAEEIEKKIPGLNVGAALSTGGGSNSCGGKGAKKGSGKGKAKATDSSLEDVFDS